MEIKISNQKAELVIATKRKAATMQSLLAIINESYDAIMKKLSELGSQPTGAPYICYTNPSADWSTFDLEMGLPIAEELPVDGEFFVTKTYEGKAIEYTHKGPYSTLDTAYGAMMKYMEDNSLESTGAYYDFYLNNPEDTPPEELLTKIVFPVK